LCLPQRGYYDRIFFLVGENVRRIGDGFRRGILASKMFQPLRARVTDRVESRAREDRQITRQIWAPIAKANQSNVHHYCTDSFTASAMYVIWSLVNSGYIGSDRISSATCSVIGSETSP